ncbi:upstream stimulatory factor 2 isoform X2 [Pogona vitticeps]
MMMIVAGQIGEISYVSLPSIFCALQILVSALEKFGVYFHSNVCIFLQMVIFCKERRPAYLGPRAPFNLSSNPVRSFQLRPACSSLTSFQAGHEKGQEVEEGVELPEVDGTNADEQTAVAIASVQQAAFTDHNIQYQFRTENNGGQVTYRVVQVTDSQLDGQTDATGAVSVVSTAAFTSGQQAVAQAVIQNPFSNGGSPATDAVSGEARFAYFPASTVGDATAVSVQTTDQSLTQAGGQFYVMMTPQDVLQTGTQRTIAPRTHPYSPKMDGTRTPRDERRRAQHNEVERRRRDKINNWIVQLSKIIPDCNTDNSKTGASKGGILSKACDYIRELRQTNQRMQETFKEAERLQMDNDMLRQQIEELKNENALLRAQMQQHGIETVGDTPGQ